LTFFSNSISSTEEVTSVETICLIDGLTVGRSEEQVIKISQAKHKKSQAL
jgi:hypothetical protein